MNKYRNRETIHRGIKFDSIAEAEYYDLALWQAEAKSKENLAVARLVDMEVIN